MKSILDLIEFIWSGNLIEEPFLKSANRMPKALPDRVKQSLNSILDRIEKEKNDIKKNAFKIAYENILSYFWRRGYDGAEISDYFHYLSGSSPQVRELPNGHEREYVA